MINRANGEQSQTYRNQDWLFLVITHSAQVIMAVLPPIKTLNKGVSTALLVYGVKQAVELCEADTIYLELDKTAGEALSTVNVKKLS